MLSCEMDDADQQDGIHYDKEQLCYTGQTCSQIPPILLEMFGPQIRRLDLSYCALNTLKGLEHFSQLEELILDNNQIHDAVSFPALSNLHTLSLNKNRLTNLETLLERIITSYPNLTFLSLHGNVACPNELSSSDKDEEDYQRYRWYVIYRLQNLKFLDSRNVTEGERQEAQRIGQFNRVVKPALNVPTNRVEEPETVAIQGPYSPLPNSVKVGTHQSAYGKCHYRYSGKHSEGNRFIRNADL